MNEFTITEGKYLWAFFEHYDFDKIMRRHNASDFAYSAGDKVYPPALEYVVFGAPQNAPEISGGLPEGLNISFASGEFNEKIQKETPRVFKDLMRENYGELWSDALKAESLTVISGEPREDGTLNYLTRAVAVVDAIAERGTAVLDTITHRLFTPEQWREKFLLPIRNKTFDPCSHAIIMIDKPNDKKRARTLGMRKFGRPDLELINVHDAYYMTSSMIEFANRIMTRHVYGVFTDEKGEIELDKSLCDFKSTLDENMNDEFFHNMHIIVDYQKCYHVDNPWMGVLG